MSSVRSLISAAGGTASRMIRTYVHYPTNSAFRTGTPLSSLLRRCALSTIPDSDTSGSHSTKKMTIRVGDNTINNLPGVSSVIQSSSLTADSSTSVSAKSSYKLMDRDERMAYLEDTIKNKDDVLMRLSEAIASVINERAQLHKKEVLTRNETERLRVIEKEDLPDMRGREKRLVTESMELKAEFRALKNPQEPADAPVPAQEGKVVLLDKFLEELYSWNKMEKNTFMDPSFDTFERILTPSYIDMPLQKRGNFTSKFWQSTRKIPNRNSIYFIQGSAGCGKTFALRQLGRVSIEDPRYHEYVCVGISFNSITAVADIERNLAKSYSDHDNAIFTFPRLIYGLFICDIPWTMFIDCFHAAFKPNKLSELLPQIFDLVKKRRANRHFQIILLVDELSKLAITDGFERTESIRRYICDLVRNVPFAYCIFSSLNFSLVEKAKVYETPTGRLLVPLGPLEMFDMEQRMYLFRYYFENYCYGIVDIGGVNYSKYYYDLISSHVIKNLSLYSAGHPRSIDAMVLSVNELLSNGGSHRLNASDP